MRYCRVQEVSIKCSYFTISKEYVVICIVGIAQIMQEMPDFIIYDSSRRRVLIIIYDTDDSCKTIEQFYTQHTKQRIEL
jgi:hypothetical protein